MRLHTLLFSIVLVAIGFISCSRHGADIRRINQAGRIIVTDPAQGLALLDSIDNPEKLGEEYYMYYIVQHFRAKYKCFEDITNDTVIFKAKKYFEENDNNPKYNAYSLYYSACLHRQRDELEEALLDNLRTMEYIRHAEDPKAPGIVNSQLGDLYFNKNMEDSAIVYYKEALPYFKSPKNDDWIIYTNRLIGESFILTNKIDSGLKYTMTSLELAYKYKDSLNISILINNLGFIEDKREQYSNSKTKFLEALRYDPKENDLRIGIYVNLANAYHNLQLNDSAFYYANLAENKLNAGEYDYKTYLNVYDCLAKLHEDTGHYEQSLDYRKKWITYNEKELARESKKDFIEIDRKYQLSQKEKELVKFRMREQFYFGAIGGFILLLSTVFFIYKYVDTSYKRAKQRNEVQALQLVVQERELDLKQRKLEAKDAEVKSKEKEMRNMLFVITIYKRLTAQLKDFEKEVDTLTYNYTVKKTTEDPAKGYQKIQAYFKKMKGDTQESMHELAMNFLNTQNLSESTLAVLSTPDLIFLSLLHCNYEHKDIAIILGVSTHALQMRKQRLRGKLESLDMPAEKIDILFSNG